MSEMPECKHCPLPWTYVVSGDILEDWRKVRDYLNELEEAFQICAREYRLLTDRHTEVLLECEKLRGELERAKKPLFGFQKAAEEGAREGNEHA